MLIRLRKAITSYLITLPKKYINPSKKTPPAFTFTALENKGIKIITSEKEDLEFKKLLTRRRVLLSLIEDDGWNWEDLDTGSYNHEIIIDDRN